MNDPLDFRDSSLAPNLTAPQHKPRPLPLFLEMLRSETAAEPARMERALRGLRAYQEAARQPPPEPMPPVAERHGARLRDYGGSGPPLLFVPSLINPPNILDLSEERSLLRWLAGRGHHLLLLDWGKDSVRRSDLSVAGHIEAILLPMIEALGEPPQLAGYCLGGTMAVAAAALANVRSLVTLAAPWRFGAYPEESRVMLARLWQLAGPSLASLDVLPMEVLQCAFWQLDPGRTIAKFEAFAGMDPGSQQARTFVTLEDWANDGPPLPAAAARELFEALFRDNATGKGEWMVGGRTIDPAALGIPQLHVASTTDRIVPEASCLAGPERLRLDRGHVGMIVGSGARTALWEPLAAWLSQVHNN
jgi:polyhydroxyalkanoate synthase